MTFDLYCSTSKLIKKVLVFISRFLEDRSSPQCRFRDQQFWAAIKVLLSNKGFFKNTFVPLSDLSLCK